MIEKNSAIFSVAVNIHIYVSPRIKISINDSLDYSTQNEQQKNS